MDKQNHFSKKLVNKSNAELRRYIEQSDQYDREAVQAAIWELEKRGEKSAEASTFEEQVILEKKKQEKDNQRDIGIPINAAKTWKRFLNFMIDGLAIEALIYSINIIPYIEVGLLFGLLIYPIYYIFFEHHYQWTPGKLITDTIVVNDHGERPKLRLTILRTFSRMVPFEPLSFMQENGWGWHDRWSKTYVIDREDLVILREKKQLTPIEVTPLKLSKIAFASLFAFVIILIISSVQNHKRQTEFQQKSREWIETLDKNDYRNIRGEWVTNNPQFQNLNFHSKESVFTSNTEFSNKILNYKIENRSLTIFNPEFSKEFVILNTSFTQYQLVDSKDPLNLITWIRK